MTAEIYIQLAALALVSLFLIRAIILKYIINEQTRRNKVSSGEERLFKERKRMDS